jgi:catechol 2,3-dioxygenase-like lactoylglutathione lyase family enzyme
MSDIVPSGLHHVTAIASDPQQNVDFYTQVLGLRDGLGIAPPVPQLDRVA